MRIAFVAPWSPPPTVGARINLHRVGTWDRCLSDHFQFSFDPVVEVPSICSATKLVQFICSLSNLLLDILHGHNRWLLSDESGRRFFILLFLGCWVHNQIVCRLLFAQPALQPPTLRSRRSRLICTMSAPSPARAAHLTYLLHLVRQEPSVTTLWITAT